MEKLKDEIRAMVKEVYPDREWVLVFGEGPAQARLMLVGEAPGEQEAMLGRPFVGKAGKLLDAFIAGTGLTRGEMYVTNTVKFRPSRISKAGRVVNRTPTQEEIAAFLPFLKKEIAQVNPACVVTLGNVPLRALLGEKETIGQAHGQMRRQEDRLYFPMYHPASMIYNPGLKAIFAQDMEKLGQLIKNIPIFNE
ncbi:MAG: uracil-DNA glycosylase [Eubacteriales bacterium]|nr:uracil-DNA glycosylase [Eubacteriales bacterium]MDO4387990.1 uracil-DNA glycosylase [Eubacteriales bacterium]